MKINYFFVFGVLLFIFVVWSMFLMGEDKIDDISSSLNNEATSEKSIDLPFDESNKFSKDNFSLIKGRVSLKERNIRVRLIQNGRIVGEVSTNRDGEFEFDNLSKGHYGLLFIYKNKVYIYNDDETEGKWYINNTINLEEIEFISISSEGRPLEIFFDFSDEKSDYVNRVLKVDYSRHINYDSINYYVKDSHPIRWTPRILGNTNSIQQNNLSND